MHVVLAAGMAATLALIPALAAIDGAHETHSYCAEHDSIEHRDVSAGRLADAPEQSQVLARGMRDDHEACLFDSVFSENKLPPAAPHLAVNAPVAIPIAGVVALEQVVRPIPLLHAAPKLPPPPAV